MSVFKKLMEARIRLQNTKLTKSGHNKFAGYTYFELGDFLPEIQKIFYEVGICGTINFYPDDTDGKGNAELRITDLNPILDGEGKTSVPTSITFVCPMASAQLKGCHEVQNLGASMTYIRRYLWVNALEIVEHDALDATIGKEGKGKGVHKPTDNISFQPDAAEVEFLTGIINNIIENEKDPAKASEQFYGSGLDNDEMTYIWNALGKYSALRKAMKDYNAALIKKEGV